MFGSLSERLQEIMKKLSGRGRLNESNIRDALQEVKFALLEADVNYKVVKGFINEVKEKALGSEVMKSLTPGQQVIKIVRDELNRIMGSEHQQVNLKPEGVTTVVLVGLNGSGKTTTCAKLGKYFQKKNHHPCLVAVDIYRPAAIKQLQTLGQETGLPVFNMGTEKNVLDIIKGAKKYAESNRHDILLIDSAGRLHVDEELMQELAIIKEKIRPEEILLVADATTGQDAVNIAREFDRRLDISGIILTKLDGDERGGAALSMKAVTGKPIKFIGTGEKLDALEPFYPDRMSSRILGMGDVLSFIEKAEEAIDKEKMEKQIEKMRQMEFNFNDFLEQFQMIKKMGPLDQLIGMIPGFSQLKQIKNFQVDEKQFKRVEAIIQSMTEEERRQPGIIDSSRKRRIAAGSGTDVVTVNKLLKQFLQMKKMLKRFTSGHSLNKWKLGRRIFPF